jgi:hypothetical protein
MAEKKWLEPYVERAVANAQQFKKRVDEQREEQMELDRLAGLQGAERQPILEEAEEFLEAHAIEINKLADDLTALAGAPVDKPEKMTAELFRHPVNIAPRLIYKVPKEGNILIHAYYFLWTIHFYETPLRLCLTISDIEEPLFVLVKDLTPDSLYRIAANNLEVVKKRLCRNIERHAYLNTLYKAGVF